MQNITTKIKILSGIIVLLLFLIGFSLYSPEQNSTLSETFSFAVSQAETIDRIQFGKIVLERKGEKNWILNQNTPADLETVKELLQILAKIDIKRPVAEAQQAVVAQKIQENGTEVQIFSNGELINQFKIAGEAENSFAISPTGEAFVVYVPSMNIVLHEVFQMSSSDWKDRTIMAVSWLGIKSLAIEYPENPEHSFVLKASEKFYSVEGVQKLDSGMVYNYLQAYQNVRAFMYLDNANLRDSLLSQKPLCRISLSAVSDSDSESVRVWGNKNALLGYMERKQQMIQLQPRSFSRLFVRKKDFEKK